MILDEPKKINLSFNGEGGQLFGIIFINMLITCFTAGLYFPWAKAKIQSYMHSSTEMEGNRFMFHGTGQEMFIGLIKGAAFVAALSGTMYFLIITLYMTGFIIAMLLFLTAITLRSSSCWSLLNIRL